MLADGVLEAFRLQAEFCAQFGSPLYAELVARAADDIAAGGPLTQLLDGWRGNPVPDALVMRVMGAVHQRVLAGEEPELARHYPSVGGTPHWPAAWEAFRRVVATHIAELRPALDRQVQTNEVRRSAALLGGFLTVAAVHGLPLRVLEIGSSAGLNLHWDRYRYEMMLEDGGGSVAPPRHVWGDAASPVTIRTAWTGGLDIFGACATVAERAGCDLAPIDVRDPAQVRGLESFVWADQLERLAQLRAAVTLARHELPPVVRRAAADWLAAQLATPRPGVATVVFHSIMWWYLSEAERTRVREIIDAAGARADAQAPFAWLRYEFMEARDPEVRLTRWPGAVEELLAHADAHGRYVRWRGGGAA